jgi:hypothetical protein
MEILVAVVNAIPDSFRYALAELLPFLYTLLELFGFIVWEDASISLP